MKGTVIMKKSWSKDTWSQIVLIAIGIILMAVSAIPLLKEALNGIPTTVCLSLGCSLVGSAIASFFHSKAEDVNLADVNASVAEIKSYVKQFTPNERIVIGKHLRGQFKTMYNESKKGNDDVVYIDVNGVELFNFWRDQEEFILNLRRFNVRLIVQNPYSKHFSDMMENEIMNEDYAKKNIIDLTKKIKKLNESGKLGNNHIEIRWLSFPASITMTRVNNQMYVRSRLINASHLDDYHFFEKYTEGDIPYSTYQEYFNDAWNKCENDIEAMQKYNEV